MKKLYSFLSFLVLTSLSFSAKAQNIYISSSFNSYNPNGDDKWLLMPGDADDEEDNVYSAYFEITDKGFTFNFQYGDKFLVPADNSSVIFSSNKYSGNFIEGESNSYWIVNDWDGNELGVVLNLAEKTVIFQKYEETSDIWFIRGAFNNYNPGNSSTWALRPSTETNGDSDVENGVYMGTFDVPEGELSFNFLSPYGSVFIPSSISTEEITFSNNTYRGYADLAYNDIEEGYYWVYPSWEGGNITVSINANNGQMSVTKSGTNSVDVISKETKGQEVIYNLQGIRVDKDRLNAGDIYILNGKKIIAK